MDICRSGSEYAEIFALDNLSKCLDSSAFKIEHI